MRFLACSGSTLVFAALLAAPLTGCFSVPAAGTFTADGFHHCEFPYAVHYASPATKEFLGADWRIDNYYLTDDGSIGERKTSREYEGREAVDLKGDGVLTRRDAFYFDLKLDNRRTSAVIWVQSVQLGPNEAERNLGNLVESYAETLSGSGFFAALNDGRTIKAKTYAAKIVEGKDTTLGGFPAYDARLELANVDQLRLDPTVRTAIIRVVLVKTNYLHRWSGDEDYPRPAIAGGSEGYAGIETRTLVRVGYSARPSDFDAGLPDFERFLKLLELGPAKPLAPDTPRPLLGRSGRRHLGG